VSPAQPTGGRRRRTTDDDPDERRQRFLERNRAAASRCRQKRKLWVSSLEKKAEELSTLNVSLSAVIVFSGEVMADRGVDMSALPKEVRDQLAELDLELSEGKGRQG
ncbi:hypothetical protein XENOCAPTIV_013690, partial [Xenoophorus captivus]